MSSFMLLQVYIEFVSGSKTTLAQRFKDQGDQWKQVYATLPVGSYQLGFHGLRGASHLSDIAIDDITVRNGACPKYGK